MQTNNYDAEYGKMSSGVIAVITKSGTNQYHGLLSEYLRNDVLNANNWGSILAKPELRRNQYGGTLGGPVIKNKAFFFGGYQGTIERSRPSTNQDWVATPAMLAGDFTAVTSSTCNSGRQINLASPFVGNRIDPKSFHEFTVISREIYKDVLCKNFIARIVGCAECAD